MTRDDTDSEQGCSPNLWECFATSVHFLTRITVSASVATREDFDHARALNRAVVFFPLVGGLIGLITASVMFSFVWLGISPLLAAFLALGWEAYMTGAFHEDAFADTCDAFGGGWTRESVLDIMKDSRLGTYGTIALVIGVAIRALAMEGTTDSGIQWTFASIVAAGMIARLVIVVIMATTPAIQSRQSQARDVSGSQSADRVMLSIVMGFPFGIAWILQSPSTALFSMLSCAMIVTWYRRSVLQRIEGTTGDVLGASGFLAQLVILTGSSVT